MSKWWHAPSACALILALQLSAQAPAPPAQQTGAPRPAARGRSFLISRDVPDPAAVARGQKDFVTNCAFCHGSSAKGGEGGPDLIRAVLVLDDEGGNLIGPVILNGRPDRGMPKFNFSKDRISDIAAFLRSLQQAAINRGAYKILDVVTGDAKAGQAYFNGAGKCNTCHSPTGDLAGVGKKYEAVALQSRFLYPQTRMRRGMGDAPENATPAKVTVTPLAGSSVSGNLEYIDDFTVGLRDAAGQYHSYAREEGVKVDVRDPLEAHEQLLKKYSDADMHNLLAYLVTLK